MRMNAGWRGRRARRDPDLVVPPLSDRPERKVDTAHRPPMRLTPTVRVSLAVLRGYLILMTLMLAYHFLDLAGVLGHHAR